MEFQPLPLGRRREPFSHQDWLFEVKYDGFRALAQIEHGRCKLVSRNGNEFKSFRTLSESLGTELNRSVILDGAIVCLDGDGQVLVVSDPVIMHRTLRPAPWHMNNVGARKLESHGGGLKMD